MEYQEKVAQFCHNQMSIGAAVGNFIGQFSGLYQEEAKRSQEILSQCIGQMFRKYYYSLLLPDVMLTPAGITNTLCEREFGRIYMAVPKLSVTYRGRKIARITSEFTCLTARDHPFLKDLEHFLEIAAAGVAMEAPGIPLAAEYAKLKDNLFLYDRHYINIICQTALTAGLIECYGAGQGLTCKTTPRVKEFNNRDIPRKMQGVIDSVANLCSNKLTESFPEFRKEFAVSNIMALLRKTKNFERLIQSLLKKMTLDPLFFSRIMEDEEFAALAHSNPAALEKATKAQWLFTLLDMYFFTPFGYYLQLIQPVYPEVYDLEMEMDRLLADLDDFTEVRLKLFSVGVAYDLTVLGEDLLVAGDKPRRIQEAPSDVDDEAMYRVVLANMDYLEAGDDDEYSAAEDGLFDDFYGEAEKDRTVAGMNHKKKAREPLQLQLDGFGETPSAGPQKKAQIIDFQAKKEAASQKAASQKVASKGTTAGKTRPGTTGQVVSILPGEKVFVFKVKLFEAKRVWRQIEIEGNRSLDDLHEAIFNSFELEAGHLYSFFISNKFWDKKSEYAHPQAEGARSARKIRLNQLGLEIKQKFCYLYDYGDEYRFEIELVALGDSAPGIRYPREMKRNKPTVTVCEQCKSDKKAIAWFCQDHQMYLCDKCAESSKHEECFLTHPIL